MAANQLYAGQTRRRRSNTARFDYLRNDAINGNPPHRPQPGNHAQPLDCQPLRRFDFADALSGTLIRRQLSPSAIICGREMGSR